MKLPLLSTSSVDPNIRDQLIYMENKEREHQNQKKRLFLIESCYRVCTKFVKLYSNFRYLHELTEIRSIS